MIKKTLCVVHATLVIAASAFPAIAMENEFGGLWRTRSIVMKNFNGYETGSEAYVDTRTRLYYTAKFSDKFKFVNKFEFDNVWGDSDGGDIGADGKGLSINNINSGGGVEVKNSYVDFTLGDNDFRVGIQPGKVARGFLFDDDFSGLTVTSRIGSLTLPFIWMKVEDNDLISDHSTRSDAAATDRDYFVLSPVFNINETLSLNPFVFLDKQQGKYKASASEDGTDTDQLFIGFDINAKIEKTISWGTFIYQTGNMDVYALNGGKRNLDISAFLLAAGADTGFMHGQAFFATGNQQSKHNEKSEFGLFHDVGKGQGYYWSEIMGEGIFDEMRSNNAPGIKISNIMAANIGATVKLLEKLNFTGDIWYAQLAEKVEVTHRNGTTSMEDKLGIEIDLKATYMVLDNLKLDVVAAYLIAGDATGEEDPIEIGTQLSFSF